MATIFFEGRSIDVALGYIVESCEDLGIPFGCREGNCGTCEVRIVSGSEHLSPQSESERDFGLPDNHRLACQCLVVKEGQIVIEL